MMCQWIFGWSVAVPRHTDAVRMQYERIANLLIRVGYIILDSFVFVKAAVIIQKTTKNSKGAGMASKAGNEA